MFNNEWVWVILVGVVLFGAGNIPKLAKGVGEGIRELKKALNGAETETKTTSGIPATADAKEN